MLKEKIAQKKLLIFDMDGTLIDSLDVWNRIDLKVVSIIRRDGLETVEEMQPIRDEALRLYSSSTNPYLDYCAHLKEKFKSDYSRDEIYSLRYKIAEEMIEKEVKYKPFVPEFLKKMKGEGKVLAIASAAQRKNLDIYRTRNQNVISEARYDDIFSLMLARNDCTEIKPHPEVFFKTLEALNFKAEDAMVFEDSLVGVEASRRAGIECCAVYDRFSDHDRNEINALADFTINSFEELL